jgi:hypothetical protein
MHLIPHPQRSEGCGSVKFTSSTVRQAAEVCTMKRELQQTISSLQMNFPYAEVTLCEVNFFLQAHSCSRTLQEKKYPRTSAQETQLVA